MPREWDGKPQSFFLKSIVGNDLKRAGFLSVSLESQPERTRTSNN